LIGISQGRGDERQLEGDLVEVEPDHPNRFGLL
jgi:hypothetical protein